MLSSYGSVPLVYSTSTQNNGLSPIKPFHNLEIRDSSMTGPSIDSSSFTFNNGNNLIRSGMQ
jgi:hypothetical protein